MERRFPLARLKLGLQDGDMLHALSNVTRRRERAFWARRAAGWERWEPVIMHALAPVNLALLRALALSPGQRVADFGCGSGDPALAIAQWVGPRGAVLGIDLSAPMLVTARRRARVLGLQNARFLRADLERFRPSRARFDRVASRFSLMFAGDVPVALKTMRDCLAPGGRAAIAVWGPMEENPGTRARMEAARPFMKEPPGDPEALAHPMRLARPGLLARLMRRAGYVRVKSEAVRMCWMLPSLEDLVRFQIESSLADLHRSLSRPDQRRLRARLKHGFRRFQSGGIIRHPGMAWVVSGERGSGGG